MLDKVEDNWINKYKETHLKKYLSLPNPKWKRISHEQEEWPDNINEIGLNSSVKCEDTENVSIFPISNNLLDEKLSKHYIDIKSSFGVGEKYVAMAEAMHNTGYFIKALKNKKAASYVYINYKANNDNKYIVDQNVILAETGSEITVIIDYASERDEAAFHNGLTKVYVEENAIVHLIKIQRLNDTDSNFDSNIIFAKNDSQIHLVHLELGAGVSGVNYITNLDGKACEADLNAIYILDKERKMDLGFTMNHKGAHTISNLDVFGALNDECKKVFRGELKFEKGTKGSKGRESESVMILGDKVKADSIPALFCSEDDVEGQHAASVGKIDENKLFYIMSRGLGEEEAKRTIIEASFMPVVDKIADEELREYIRSEILKKI